MNEDNLWIERFRAGGAEGFEMLVRKYQNRVLNIVYSLVGRDRESEDISQEVFLKVYRNLSSFKQRCLFFTWLYRIIVNTTYDFLRKRKNFVSDTTAVGNIAVTHDSPADSLLKEEKKVMLRKALAQVPLKYRIALVLRDVDGLSYGQIAQVLSCRIGTVESRIYRARQFLKELLKREEESYE